MKQSSLCVAIAFAMALVGCQAPADGTVTVVDRPFTNTQNAYYVSNRAPLQPQLFIKLPSGTIKPTGWIGEQIRLQQEGLNGHLGEISAWLQKEGNAWLTTGGQWGWEEVPYWLRGYAALSYITKDPAMLAEAGFWIERIMDSQRPDGNFGPVKLNDGKQDYWPNMIVLWIVQNYYEYTQEARVLDFMTRYCHYLLTVPEEDFLYSYWENSRAGDNLWSTAWLYNRTGDTTLLTLADKLHRNTANWTRASQLPNWHNVNVAQCFREPAIYYQFTGDSSLLAASYNAQSLVRRAFGQVPGGMFGADENARIGFFDPRQGTESCGFVEQMASDEIMLLVSGDRYWAENCEDVAFNSYPASMMPDLKSLRYITSPNHVISDSENHAPGIDNNGPFLSMNPFSSRCCQHNHGFGWPYYVEHLLLATPDNGIAAVLYGSCEARVQVGNGNQGTWVTVQEETHYPFEESVAFTVTLDTTTASPSAQTAQVSFPLYLRIPSWCDCPALRINGAPVALATANLANGQYLRIERAWQDGDRVELGLPMHLSFRTWQVNKNSVSVDYGPLTLSLKIDEEYRQMDSKATAIRSSRWQEGVDASKWPTYEIFPTSAWNYALRVKDAITLTRRSWPADNNPFTLTSVPLEFHAKGQLVPSWTIDEYGLCGILPYEDAPKAERIDDITLVPMGAARLRISAFPTAGE